MSERRALRKLRTFHREQSTLEVVMEVDDEFRAMKLCHRSLMKLRPEARRRVVRYMVERHVSATEPEEQHPATAPEASEEARRGVYAAEASIAEAKRHMEASA